MNVGFYYKRIGPCLLCRFGSEFVSRTDNQMADLFDGFWLEKTHIVVNASPIETGVFVPISDPHDVSEGAMLFGQILQLVIIQFAAGPHGGQDEDLPVVHSLASAVVSRVPLDILGDQIENRVPQFRLAVDVLQSGQDGDDLITTFQIQLDVEYGSAIQSRLLREGFSHPFAPRRKASCVGYVPCVLIRAKTEKVCSSRSFLQKKMDWSIHEVCSEEVAAMVALHKDLFKLVEYRA